VCDSGCVNVVVETDGLPVFEAEDEVVDDNLLTTCDVVDVVVGVVTIFSLSSVDDCSVTH
jgi:hypothetical protein